MQYNTDRKEILMPEYGRHVQNLVDFAMAEEDPIKQKDIIDQVLILMAAINPNAKNVSDYEHKLWDHLFIMSDFQLNCESPYPKPTREEVFAKPERFAYPQQKIKHRHYGKNIEQMIEKAIALEDEEKQAAYTDLIAKFMKRTYEMYNNDRVNDDIIKEDLVRLSDGELSLDENKRIFVKRSPSKARKTNTRQTSSNHRNNNNRRRTSTTNTRTNRR